MFAYVILRSNLSVHTFFSQLFFTSKITVMKISNYTNDGIVTQRRKYFIRTLVVEIRYSVRFLHFTSRYLLTNP